MNAAVVRRTQEALGKVIRRPPLTEKLLSKPPFRYLHDIVTEVGGGRGRAGAELGPASRPGGPGRWSPAGPSPSGSISVSAPPRSLACCGAAALPRV